MDRPTVRRIESILIRATYGVTGVVLLFAGVCGLVVWSAEGFGLWPHLLSLVGLFGGGAFLVWAGVAAYEGEWPTYIGTLLIVFAGFGLAAGMDKHGRDQPVDIQATIMVGGFFFLCGLLLLKSGQRLIS